MLFESSPIAHTQFVTECQNSFSIQLTKHLCDEPEGKLRGKESEEPRSGVEGRTDLILLQMVIQTLVEVMEQTRQLVHLDLNIDVIKIIRMVCAAGV